MKQPLALGVVFFISFSIEQTSSLSMMIPKQCEPPCLPPSTCLLGTCIGSDIDNEGYFYHKPTKLFKLDDTALTSVAKLDSGERQSNEDAEKTVKRIEDGYATQSIACVFATKGVTATIYLATVVRAVSSDKIQTKALTLSKYLKQEYRSTYKKEVKNKAYGHDNIWTWLGISPSGKYSSSKETVDKYENGEQSLDEARTEFTREITNELDAKTEIIANATITGIDRIGSEFCLFFAIQNVKFSEGKDFRVVVNDAKQAKTGTQEGSEVPNDGLQLTVIDTED